MELTIECTQCEADFSMELSDILKDPDLIVCPNCEAKTDPAVVETLATSLEETSIALARIRSKFLIELSINSDELDLEESDYYDDEEPRWDELPEEEEEEEEEDEPL
jgi:hypothetical protein